MANSDLVFIIGRQRSGTTVFRDLLKRNGALDCDEVFHGDLSKEHRFYGYLQKRLQADPALIHPQTHPRVFREYIEDLRNNAQGRLLALDVKYFALNLIPAQGDVTARNPFLLNFMRNSKAHVVHIVRKNKLRVYVSEEMSKATGKWSAEKPEHLLTEKPKLEIDPEQAMQFITTLIRQDEGVAEMLQSIPGVHRLDYEEMFEENGNFSDKTMQVAEACLDAKIESNRPGNLRMNPEPISELISNYDKLHEVISNSPHAWMLSS